jgi:phage repressor protein C with HTH and peptisase S24 domain
MPDLELRVNPDLARSEAEVPEKSTTEASTDMAIRTRLKAIVEERGGNAAFSRKSGIPLSSLNNYLSGTALKLGVAIQIADAAGISVDELLGREPALIRANSGTPEGFVPVPFLEVRASAGRGRASLPAETVAAEHFLFSRAWLRSLNITPEDAELLQAEGDSMYPTIQDGDLMLVDRGFGEVVHGKIYALVSNGLVIVKRVNFLAGGGMILLSDNDRYPSETIRRDEVGDLSFQGRIAWYGRTI